MTTLVRTIESNSEIRVALIIEQGRIKPVWFEEIDKPGRDRIVIKEICYKWIHSEGRVKIINFSVWDGRNNYRLSLNTVDFTWELGVAEYVSFP